MDYEIVMDTKEELALHSVKGDFDAILTLCSYFLSHVHDDRRLDINYCERLLRNVNKILQEIEDTIPKIPHLTDWYSKDQPHDFRFREMMRMLNECSQTLSENMDELNWIQKLEIFSSVIYRACYEFFDMDEFRNEHIIPITPKEMMVLSEIEIESWYIKNIV